MKIRVYVLVVDNYLPEVCNFTLPLIKKYSKKINAEFFIINERKYSDLPITYEKMQIYELGKDYDYNILIDADMIIHPNMYNIFDIIPENCICAWHAYPNKLYPIEYGIATNFIVVPKFCHNVWKPFDEPYERLKELKRDFIFDEYCFSYNYKKYGYKISGLEIPNSYGKLFYHLNVNTDNKDSEQIKDELERWKYLVKINY